MRKSYLILVLIFIGIILLSCQEKPVIISPKYEFILTPISVPTKDTIIVSAIEEDSANWSGGKIIIEVKLLRQNFVMDGGAVSHSWLDTTGNQNYQHPIFLDTNKLPSMVIRTADKTSTYGATALFIVWGKGFEWYITQAPFGRAELRDIDDDGIFEIVETLNPQNPKGDAYRFYKGNFQRLLISDSLQLSEDKP